MAHLQNSEYYASILDAAYESVSEGRDYYIHLEDSTRRDALRMALYARIRQERKKMQKQCSPDDRAWGVSPWDTLSICKQGSRTLVFKGPPQILAVYTLDDSGKVLQQYDPKTLKPIS